MRIQAQACDNGGHTAHGGKQPQGDVCTIADNDKLAVRLPTLHEADELVRPQGDGLAATLAALDIALRGGPSGQTSRRAIRAECG